MTKNFPIEIIVSAVTGRACFNRQSGQSLSDLQGLFDTVLGFSVFTHELITFAPQVREELHRQLPWSEGLQLPAEVDEARESANRGLVETLLEEWMDELAGQHGTEIEIRTMDNPLGRSKSPVHTLYELTDAPVLVVTSARASEKSTYNQNKDVGDV